MSGAAPRRALFLDRDGVINVDHAYVHQRERFEFIDGIFELCRAARARGFLIAVVTNQAGIGRGYYTEADFHALSEWMCEQFRLHDAAIDGVYFCPDHPQHGLGAYKRESAERKPGPGMLLRAAAELNIDLAGSLMVGDKESDLQAGAAAGVPCLVSFRNPAANFAHAELSARVHFTDSMAEVRAILLALTEEA